MEKLQWIEIKNFRGIKYAKLENFTDINIFIGKNNTGKSTVLEAIYLNLLRGGIDPIFRKLVGRSEKTYSYTFILLRRYFIYYSDLSEKEISLFLNSLFYKTSNSFEIITNVEHLVAVKEPLLKFIWKNANRAITVGEYPFSLHYLLDGVEIKPEFKEYSIIFLDPEYPNDFYITYIYKKQWEFDVKNVVKTSLFPILMTNGFGVDLPATGRGFQIYVIWRCFLKNAKNFVILIEEPEVHQHPKSLELIAEAVVHSAKNNKNQIFISTHSLEFLEMLLKKAKEENVDVNVYKFVELKDGELKYKIYKRDEALAGLEIIGYDLRQ